MRKGDYAGWRIPLCYVGFAVERTMQFGRALRILLGLSLLLVASAKALSIDGTGFSSTLIAPGRAEVALPALVATSPRRA